MPTKRFDFFRLRLLNDRPSLFANPPRGVLLARLVDTLHERSSSGHLTWQVGNVEDLGDNQRYFCLGKSKRKRTTAYQDGNFVEQSTEEHPYTEIYMNGDLGVVFIAHSPELADDTESIARRLAFMLHLAGGSSYENTEFRADAVVDAEAFIEEIRKSKRITSFSFSYSLPNPVDANKILQEPLEQSLQEIKAQTGRVTMKGNSLDFEALEDAARSLAASGEEVSARFVPENGRRSEIRKIGNHPYSKNVDKGIQDRTDVAELLTQSYQDLRGQE